MKHHHRALDRTTDDEAVRSCVLGWLRLAGCNCGPWITPHRCPECEGIENVEIEHHRDCAISQRERVLMARFN